MPSITQLSQRKSTTHMLNPADIVANPNDNARFANPDPKKVERIAKSMLEGGQLEPVGIRPNPDKEQGPLLVFGTHRYLAAKLINDKGLTGPAHDGSGPFLLECKIMEPTASTDLEAFKRSIMENNDRAATGPMDDARNLHRLVTDFGLSRIEAASIYGKPASFASRRLALLTLAPDLQDKIANGSLGVAAAEELAKAPEEAKEAIEAKIRRGEKVAADDVVGAGRDLAEAKSNAKDPEPSATPPDEAPAAAPKAPAHKKVGRPKAANRSRTSKEVRILMKSLMEDDNVGLARVGVLFASWMDGKLTDNGLRRKLTPLLCKEDA